MSAPRRPRPAAAAPRTASGVGRPSAAEQTAAVLAAAVAEIGGHERPGQLALAAAVGDAFDTGVHVLAQAGTGTGKSLGYLAPTLVRLARGDLDRVVVTTATLALQSQLAGKDIPHALDAVEAVTGRRPRHAILKGRTNYACLLKVRDGADDQAALIPASELVASLQESPRAAPESALGAEVLALREWAEEQLDDGALADRDDAPTHTDRGWQQVSIPVRECLGTQRCPQGGLCFVEKSREVARAADLVVTNHALLAIDAMHGGTALPEHQAVVIDEAHELTARGSLGRAESGDGRPGGPAGAGLVGRRRPGHRAAGLGRHAPGRAGGDPAGAGRGRRRSRDRGLRGRTVGDPAGGQRPGERDGQERARVPTGRRRRQGGLRRRGADGGVERARRGVGGRPGAQRPAGRPGWRR